MQLGLRAKLTFAIAFLIVAFAGFFALYFPTQQEEAAATALRSRAKSISAALSTGVAKLVATDQGQVQTLLEDFAESPAVDRSDIASIVIVRPNGSPFARYPAHDDGKGYGPAPATGLTPDSPFRIDETDDMVIASVAIFPDREDSAFGILTTTLSQDSVRTARASGRASALVVAALILVIGVIVAWLVGGGIATPILHAARQLDAVSSTLVAAARDQEASSAEEAAAVAQTRRSMETLLDSAQQIADRSSEVLGNAERSTNGSRQIADRIGNLNELSEKVADILAVIMQVADKADLLALNASLEGTRAGDAGKGFTLVAAEMRRLAENVMESVAGIRELMKDMREASQAAVTASEEGTKSSTATTHSAREIALLTQEQRQATEQVMASMDEMGEILNHTLDGIQRTTASASQLTELARTLADIVNPAVTRQRHDSELEART